MSQLDTSVCRRAVSHIEAMPVLYSDTGSPCLVGLEPVLHYMLCFSPVSRVGIGCAYGMGMNANGKIKYDSPMKPESEVNKLNAPIGTYTTISYPDLTSWILCGWSVVRDGYQSVMIKKVK